MSDLLEWKPISSAPKDGTKILLWTDTRASSADEQEYVTSICEGQHFATVQTGSWWTDGTPPAWEKELIGEPTHWMPLPTPPRALASEEEKG